MAYDIKLTWIDANGARFPLSDAPDIEVLFDLENFFMPEIRYETVEVVDRGMNCVDGTPKQDQRTVERLVVEERDLPFKIRVRADDPVTLHQTIRKYVQAFSPLKGEGTLEVTAPDGQVRVIHAKYHSGLEGVIREKNTSPLGKYQEFPLILVAHDPYFQATSTTSFTLQEGQTAFFFPILPLVLSHYETFGEQDINNDGDVEAWPTWIIDGPFDTLRLDNLTTDEYLHIHTPITAGDRVTITTEPGNWSIIRASDGANLYEFTSPNSRMFPFIPGLNKIRVEMTNAGSETQVQISFVKRYLSI